jgi:hypothetical protein
MGLLDSLFGSTQESQVNYLPEQIKDIQQTNQFKTDVMNPAWKDYINYARTSFGENMPGMTKAAQGLAGYAGQVGDVMGQVGESNSRVSSSGLQSFFDPQFGAEQFQAAMAPIQGQYMQNMANQGAQFGGAGNLGSSRQALAGAQAAGANNAAQMQAAAQVMNNLNNQRLQAGQSLMTGGMNQLQTGLGAKGTQLGAAERQLDYTTTLGKQMNMIPQGAYTAQYPGQQSTTQTKTDSPMGILGSLFGGLF